MIRLENRKHALNGKTREIPDNSMIPAARVGVTEVVMPSVKKYALKPSPRPFAGVIWATKAFMGDHMALLKNE